MSSESTSDPQTFLREFDKKLWTTADRLHANLDAAVYKHAVLGLISLKYISDSFAQRQTEIEVLLKAPDSNYFIDPKGYDTAFSEKYAEEIHAELEAIEKENPKLKGVLDRRYTQHAHLHAKNILGHVYEYFLGQFALAGGKKGGQYFTPKSIVSLIVEMIKSYHGRICAPAMGSVGFFVQTEHFIKEWWDGKLEGNANFAWVQHMLDHLAPNGSMSSNSGGEGDIRRALIEADLVECMVALPGQLFTNTQIPACICIIALGKPSASPGSEPFHLAA